MSESELPAEVMPPSATAASAMPVSAGFIAVMLPIFRVSFMKGCVTGSLSPLVHNAQMLTRMVNDSCPL